MPEIVLPANRGGAPRLSPPEIDRQQFTALELLQQCVGAGKDAAWLEFLRLIRPFLAAIITSNIRHWKSPDSCLVDDLVQNTYLKLCANDFKALRELDCPQENALFGFLKVVASNVVQDHFRSWCCQKRGSGKAEDDLEKVRPTRDQIHNFDRHLERRILLGQIERCLRDHSREARFDRDYKIFWLYYSQGLTAREISEQPNIDLGTKGVESTLLRLTRLVRIKFNQQPSRLTVTARAS